MAGDHTSDASATTGKMIKLKLNPKKLEESLRKSEEKKQEQQREAEKNSPATTIKIKAEPSENSKEVKKRKRESDHGVSEEPLPKISIKKSGLPKIKVKVGKSEITSSPAAETQEEPKKPKIRLSSSLLGHAKKKDEEGAKTDKKETHKPKVSLSLKTKSETLPRIRVKASRQPGQGYDSEAPDREDDPMIEEAIILRMVPGAHLDYLRATCDAGDLSRVNIKFKDARRAVVSINEQLFAAKLVDLPTITEAHKTFDRKNIYKVSDICQMLLVTEPISAEDDVLHLESTSIERPEATAIPHGITPPLHNVKHRRFRKRISRKVIETMEAKIEELFRLDDEAEETHYELLDPGQLTSTQPTSRAGSAAPRSTTPQANKKDSLGLPRSEADDAPALYNMLSSRAVSPAQNSEQEDEEDEEDLLGLELERALEGEESEDDDDDDDDDDEDDDEDEGRTGPKMDEDILEAMSHNKIIREEIKDLEASIRKKRENAENTFNALLRDRFLKVVRKLEQELEVKKRQLRNVKETENAEEKPKTEDLKKAGSEPDNFDSPYPDDGDTPMPTPGPPAHEENSEDDGGESEDAMDGLEKSSDVNDEDDGDDGKEDQDIESLF